jgi:CDP-paratose 2-epimerase
VNSEAILITGGAGFIGSNLAHRLLDEGHQVTIFDNLSRSGCETNVAWLRRNHGADSLAPDAAELTDFAALCGPAKGHSASTIWPGR